jgi:hypothetical protein
MASCENKVDNVATVNFPISKEESVSLKLKSHVTSGIADSQGRSKKLLNEKAQTIEKESRLICSLF